MNIKSQLKSFTAAVVVLGALVSSNAHAGGFIGDIVKGISPEMAVIVDPIEQYNAQTKVFEQVVANGMNGYVPGSGDAYMAYVRMQQMGGAIPAPGNPGFPQQPQFQPQQAQFFPQQPQVMPQQVLGSRCLTAAGPSNPGMLQPLGSPCQSFTQYGPLNGQIIQ